MPFCRQPIPFAHNKCVPQTHPHTSQLRELPNPVARIQGEATPRPHNGYWVCTTHPICSNHQSDLVRRLGNAGRNNGVLVVTQTPTTDDYG